MNKQHFSLPKYKFLGNFIIYEKSFGMSIKPKNIVFYLQDQDDGVNQSKMGMLVDVLGLEGNIGQVPTRYRSCLPNSSA
jgi:hypothetical protein